VDWQSVWLKMSWQARSRHAPDWLSQLHELDSKARVDRLRLQHLLLNVEVVVGRVVVVAAVDPCVALALVAAHIDWPARTKPVAIVRELAAGHVDCEKNSPHGGAPQRCRSARTAPASRCIGPPGKCRR
jgi:hypothetical protein